MPRGQCRNRHFGCGRFRLLLLHTKRCLPCLWLPLLGGEGAARQRYHRRKLRLFPWAAKGPSARVSYFRNRALLRSRKVGFEADAWVCETLLGHQRVICWISGVPVVEITSQLPVQFRVLSQLVPVEADAEPRRLGDLDAAIPIVELSTLYDVVIEMMVVGVRREGEVWHHGPQVEHCRQLDAELPGGVYGHA